MSAPDLHTLKAALVDAGLELYREDTQEIHVAERVRLHLMDSGVRVLAGEPPVVTFTARSQRSDYPRDDAAALFDHVRHSVGEPASARGYVETQSSTVTVTDPVDDAHVLDVWHEVTYTRATSLDDLVEEVRWALTVEKYVTPH